MNVVDFTPGSPPKLSPPRALFQTAIKWDERCRNAYLVASRGRFLAFNSLESRETRPLEVLVNWAQVFRRASASGAPH